MMCNAHIDCSGYSVSVRDDLVTFMHRYSNFSLMSTFSIPVDDFMKLLRQIMFTHRAEKRRCQTCCRPFLDPGVA